MHPEKKLIELCEILFVNNTSKILLYYSNEPYNTHKRATYIMTKFDRSYIKVTISQIKNNIPKYDIKNNHLIVPYTHKNTVLNSLKQHNVSIYYTNATLCNEIINIPHKKMVIYDIINVPVNNYKYNQLLIKSVQNANIVTYSNSQIKSYLNKINDQKLYHYIEQPTKYIKQIKNMVDVDYEFTLFFPSIRWNYMVQRPQQLTKNLSKQNIYIYYIDTGCTHSYKLKKNLEIISPLDFHKKYVSKRLKIYNKLVFMYSCTEYHTYIDRYHPDLVLYDYVDNDTDEFSKWSKYFPDVIKKTNIITYTALNLGKKLVAQYNFMNTKYVPNGSDINNFNKVPKSIPSDLLQFRKKHKYIIGYYGAIATWMDMALVTKISKKYPIVIIGKKHNNNGYQTVNIPYSNNILVLPAKKYEDLYKYLYYFDIAMIPFKLTKMTHCCDPCKFYEYISMGKPVITTRMQPLVRFNDICSFININNFNTVIQNEIKNLNNIKLINKRKEVAKQNTWYQRSVDIYNFIKDNII